MEEGGAEIACGRRGHYCIPARWKRCGKRPLAFLVWNVDGIKHARGKLLWQGADMDEGFQTGESESLRAVNRAQFWARPVPTMRGPRRACTAERAGSRVMNCPRDSEKPQRYPPSSTAARTPNTSSSPTSRISKSSGLRSPSVGCGVVSQRRACSSSANTSTARRKTR